MGCGIARAGDKIKDQLAVHRLYFKYDHFIQETNIMFNSTDFLRSSYILFLHHVLPILHICFVGAWFSQQAYAQGLDKMIIVQVVGPPIGWTSPPTNLSDYSTLTPAWCSLHHRLVGWTAHRMGFIVSYAGDSSAFGFLVQVSSAKLETPLVVGSFYVSSVCYQVAPCCSDQGANLGQHVWVLICTCQMILASF